MAINVDTATAVATALRLAFAVVILHLYLKNKKKIALYFGLFFLLFSLHGIFRFIAVESGQAIWFFLHRISLKFSTLMILIAIADLGARWIRRYKILPLFAIASASMAYIDAYIFGGLAGEQTTLLAGIIGFGLAGTGLLISAYYLAFFARDLPPVGRRTLSLGLASQGILLFTAIFLIQSNLTGLAFIIGLINSTLIALGAWLSFWSIGYIEERAIIRTIEATVLFLITIVEAFLLIEYLQLIGQTPQGSSAYLTALPFISLAVAVIIVALLGLFTIKQYIDSVLEAIDSMSATFEKISMGDLDAELDPHLHEIDGKIAKLAKSFERMKSSVKLAKKETRRNSSSR